jgi:hypothetical protein
MEDFPDNSTTANNMSSYETDESQESSYTSYGSVSTASGVDCELQEEDVVIGTRRIYLFQTPLASVTDAQLCLHYWSCRK